MLHCVTSYFNPSGYKKLKENYINFRRKFSASLTTVEVSFDGSFFIDDSIKIKANTTNILWQKERCLNIAIESLPENAEAIAWVDADLYFTNPFWEKDLLQALENYHAVQPFDYITETNRPPGFPNKGFSNRFTKHDLIGISYAKLHNTSNYYAYSVFRPDTFSQKQMPFGTHVGRSWAVRGEIWKKYGGIWDKCANSKGDILQVSAFAGAWDGYAVNLLTASEKKDYLQHAKKQYDVVNSNIGCIKNTAIHLFHGRIADRQYNLLAKNLYKTNFSFDQDIHLDSNGLYAWNNPGSSKAQTLRDYFMQRHDDFDISAIKSNFK